MGTQDDPQFDANRRAVTRAKNQLKGFLERKNNPLLSPAERALIESTVEQLEDLEQSLAQEKSKGSGKVKAGAIGAAIAIATEIIRQIIKRLLDGG